MDDSQPESEDLSMGGVLFIIGIVGLNTAFTLRDEMGESFSIAAVQTWLPEFSIQIILVLLVTGVIVVHLRW